MKFRAKKNLFWECWGKIIIVAKKDDIMEGYLVHPFRPERPWEYASIHPTFYPHLSDFASRDEVEPV